MNRNLVLWICLLLILPGICPRVHAADSTQAFAISLLQEAEKLSVKQRKPYNRGTALQRLGSAWIGIDNKRAARLLEAAWKLSKQISYVPEHDGLQIAIIEDGWAGVDPTKARAMSKAYPDDYWRDWLLENLPGHAARLNPARGIPILMSISDKSKRDMLADRETSIIASKDPLAAVRFIRRVKSTKQDEAISDLVMEIADVDSRSAEAITAEIKSPAERDRARWLIAGSIRSCSPDDAVILAERITDMGLKSRALAEIVEAIAPDDPVWARRLAGEAIYYANQVEKPSDRMYLFPLVAYRISGVDVEGARNILQEPTTNAKSENRMMWGWRLRDLAGAWAFVDLDKADSLYQEAVRLDPSGSTEAHDLGGFIDDSVGRYVAGVALKDVGRAVSLAKNLAKQVSDPDAKVMSAVVEPLALRNRDKAIQFAEAYGGSRFKRKVEQQLIAGQILGDPEHAQALLPSFQGSDAQDRDEVIGTAAFRLSRTSLPAARKLVEAIKGPRIRIQALCRIAVRYRRDGRREAMAVFKEAAALARRQKPDIAVPGLIDIAEALLPVPKY